MDKTSKKASEKVAVLPHELLPGVINQLNEASEEIWRFAGEYPDQDTQCVVDSIQTWLTAAAINLKRLAKAAFWLLLAIHKLYNPPKHTTKPYQASAIAIC